MERGGREMEVEIRNRPGRTSDDHDGYGGGVGVDEGGDVDDVDDYSDHDDDVDVDLHGEEVLGGGLPLLLSLFCCLPPTSSSYRSC